MKNHHYVSILLTLLAVLSVTAARSEYKPSKVVYDVSTASAEELGKILDRVNLLQITYGNDPFEASIILVIHEGAIPLFARANNQYNTIMQRAESLTMAEIIEFRICSASARMQGFNEQDFHQFTTMVPMADAEIVKLQMNGYAYLR